MHGNININIIAAVGPNNEIGYKNDLIYRCKHDMNRFKALTTGHTVIMGFNTFKSLPNGALPNRTNIVLSDDPCWAAENVIIATSIDDALSKIPEGETDVYIIGGGMVYKQFVPMADHILLSEFKEEKEADTFFPKVDWHNFDPGIIENYSIPIEPSEEDKEAGITQTHNINEPQPTVYTYVEYHRIRPYKALVEEDSESAAVEA